MTDYGPEIVRGSAAWPEVMLRPRWLEDDLRVMMRDRDISWYKSAYSAGCIDKNDIAIRLPASDPRNALIADGWVPLALGDDAPCGCDVLHDADMCQIAYRPKPSDGVEEECDLCGTPGCKTCDLIPAWDPASRAYVEPNTVTLERMSRPTADEWAAAHAPEGYEEIAIGVLHALGVLIAEPEPTLLDQYDGPITPEVRAFAAWMKGRE